MARYMIQPSYSTQGIADLVSNPQDRAAAVRPLVERLGGSWRASTSPLVTSTQWLS